MSGYFLFLFYLVLGFGIFVFTAALLTGKARKAKVVLKLGLFLLFIVIPACTCLRFHPSHAFISRSPVNRFWAIDCVRGGFRHPSYNFRAHDFYVDIFAPVNVGELFWEGRYDSESIYWSKDGTLAAATVVSYESKQEVFTCAYDFRSHRVIQFDDRNMQHEEIQKLFTARGGSDKTPLPSVLDL